MEKSGSRLRPVTDFSLNPIFQGHCHYTGHTLTRLPWKPAFLLSIWLPGAHTIQPHRLSPSKWPAAPGLLHCLFPQSGMFGLQIISSSSFIQHHLWGTPPQLPNSKTYPPVHRWGTILLEIVFEGSSFRACAGKVRVFVSFPCVPITWLTVGAQIVYTE